MHIYMRMYTHIYIYTCPMLYHVVPKKLEARSSSCTEHGFDDPPMISHGF